MKNAIYITYTKATVLKAYIFRMKAFVFIPMLKTAGNGGGGFEGG